MQGGPTLARAGWQGRAHAKMCAAYTRAGVCAAQAARVVDDWVSYGATRHGKLRPLPAHAHALPQEAPAPPPLPLPAAPALARGGRCCACCTRSLRGRAT